MKMLTPQGKDNLHSRVLALLEAGIDIGKEFLNESKFGAATKLLVDQIVSRLVENIKKRVLDMPEDDIRKQVEYIRDEVIPYILGGSDGKAEDSHQR